VAGRFSALALSGGVAISYVAIGLLVATIGARSGLGTSNLRAFAAALMLLASVVLLSESLQQRFALVGGRIESAADRLIARVSPSGYGGQFVIGGLLGAVWSPCVGPTLAAAATLAAQRETLGQATVVMLLFGLGAALPLALVGTLSRKALGRWQSRMAMAGRAGKLLLGGVLALTSVAVITGLDRAAETYLLNVSPAWLTNMTIRF